MMSIEEDVLTAVDLLTHRDDALFREIVRIAALHGWAEQYILSYSYKAM